THLPAADIDDQTGDVFEMLRNGGEIHAALKAVAGLGAELVATRAPHDGFWPPERRLDVDVSGIQGNRRSLAAHDARQTFDLIARADDAHIGVELDGLAIEQLKLLAMPGPAYGQAAIDPLQIEDVRWATEFQHDVVGNIDQRRNRPLPCPFEPGSHP